MVVLANGFYSLPFAIVRISYSPQAYPLYISFGINNNRQMIKVNKITACIIILLLTLPPRSIALAGETHVAVAANFLGAMKKISTDFESQTGHKVIISAGSTGALYSQIINGAPFDLFFSADDKRPEKLEADGLAVQGTRFTYALGGIALYSSTAGYVDPEGKILSVGRYKRLAIANPKIAPYGIAAVEAIENMGLTKKVDSKLTLGGSVAHAFQFTASGGAELGFVALSQIIDAGPGLTGSYWIVDKSLYNPVRQQAIMLRKGKNNIAAIEFIKFFHSEKAIKVIHDSGYDTP